jgi:hypothetical protein
LLLVYNGLLTVPIQYLDTLLAEEFSLRREKTAKPVLGADDLILLLTYYWAWDTSIFQTEDQRLSLAAIMLLLIYTGCRPAELVDAAKRKASCREQVYKDDNWDSGYKSLDEVKDEDPVYKSLEPWANPNNTDYNNDYNADTLTQEYKALCYKDICL